jgi:hypothetical protein
MDYQQHGADPTVDYWHIHAINLATGQAMAIADSATSSAGQELPSVAVSEAGLVVWDAPKSSGRALMVRDANTGNASAAIPLPASVYPTHPQIEGNMVVFLDNKTDPNQASEVAFTRGGQLVSFDLATGTVTKLSSTPDAGRPMFSGGRVIWETKVPDPAHPGSQSLVPQINVTAIKGSSETLAHVGSAAQISANYAVWYDFESTTTMAHSFSTGRTVTLGTPALTAPSRGALYALCGSTLYYYSDTGHQTRFLNLDEAFRR